jgi:hypothetical protein
MAVSTLASCFMEESRSSGELSSSPLGRVGAVVHTTRIADEPRVILMRRLLPVLALVALLAGCSEATGPKLYPVTGTVTVGGKPAAGALIVFHPRGNDALDAVRPGATVRADGTYTLVSPGPREGAPAGEYDVAVTWSAPPPAAAPGAIGGGEEKTTSDSLGGRYKDPRTSTLKATVHASPTQVPTFELK